MARKPNYSFERRQRELAKAAKKAAKREAQREAVELRRSGESSEGEGSAAGAAGEVTNDPGGEVAPDPGAEAAVDPGEKPAD